jgi:methionyl-tRNA formyltransferase
MKLVFMGTPEFAVPSLERLVSAGHEVAAVFTQPDRPKGRGQKETMPPVKEAALRLGLPVHQPVRVRAPEVVAQLATMGAEAMIVVGYGQIIPRSILDLPPRGILNVHASLLPKYRGAAPIQWAIANGETRTGVTIMKIDAGLDTGDMLTKWETEIGPEETSPELGARMAAAGADLLVETLAKLDEITPEPQDHAQATWAPVIKKEDGRVDWSWDAAKVVNRMRGFTPWPGCYAILRGSRFHIWRARVVDRQMSPGELRQEGRRLFAGCGQGSLELFEVQLEGKKRMEASAFLNGFTVQAGEVLQ